MLKKLDQHLWYLSEELIVLIFFSSKLSHAEMVQCSRAMKRNFKKMDCLIPDGKLTTPVPRLSTKLWHLFGPKSWLIFKLLNRNQDSLSFIEKPVNEWANDNEYKTMKAIVANMQVVNDPAERGILLAKTLQGKISFDQEERRHLFLSIP